MGFINAFKGAYKGFLNNRHETKVLPRQTRGTFKAAKSNALTYNWKAPSGSADRAIKDDNKIIRYKARQMIRDNVWVKNTERSLVLNVVGTGTKPQLQVKKTNGKLNDKQNVAIESLWAEWSRYDSFTASGIDCLASVERKIVSTLFSDGEIFVRLIKRSFGRSKIPLAIELLEADQLDDNYEGTKTKNDSWRLGILRDKYGRAKKYAFYAEHPDDVPVNFNFNKKEHTIIDASEIIHLTINNRVGQTRGVSWLASALTDMHQLAGFQEATVVGKRISSSTMGFITTTDPEGLIGDDVIDNERVRDFSAGQFHYLGANESITVPDLGNKNDNFETFTSAMLRALCAGTGTSFESISKDFSKTNYSSSRLSLMEDRDHYRMIQTYLKDHFFQPLFDIWIELAVASQQIELANYELNPQKYKSVHWMFRGWSYVDPQKEIASYKEAIKAGLKTKSQIISEQGGDIHDLMMERKNEIEMAEEMGLNFDVDMISNTTDTQYNEEDNTKEPVEENEKENEQTT
nr:phage portal protein [uncultured Mediterranean phage uvMED]BAR26599.1 phage portal protein [uncultured Mediterranean phage uvMED]BAR26660.1 phage portal protein [uncultured Mediterranean phage uvMED]